MQHTFRSLYNADIILSTDQCLQWIWLTRLNQYIPTSSSLKQGYNPHRRWRWAAFLQRCNNVAQRLSNVLQRWYNVAISCATQHNVVQRDQAMLYFPQRCTALSKRCQTLASVAKLLSNVFQRCRNTWQFAASRWRQAACLQRCNNVAQQVPDAVQRRYKVGQRSTTMRNTA